MPGQRKSPEIKGFSGKKTKHGNSITITVLIWRRWRDSHVSGPRAACGGWPSTRLPAGSRLVPRCARRELSPFRCRQTKNPVQPDGVLFGGDGEIRPARAPRRHARGHRNMPPACFSRFARALFESLQPQIKKADPPPMVGDLFFMAEMERFACIRFFLAGDGKI